MASAPWLQFLEPGEQVLWSGATSDELRLREAGLQRRRSLVVLLISIVIGLMLAAGLATTPGVKPGWFIPDWTGMFVQWPLYMLGISVCVIAALFSAFDLGVEISPQRSYALTTERLLAFDPEGVVVRRLARDKVGSVGVRERVSGNVLTVQLKGSLTGDGALMIRNVADLPGLEQALRAWLSSA